MTLPLPGEQNQVTPTSKDAPTTGVAGRVIASQPKSDGEVITCELSIDQAEELLDVSAQTLSKWLHEGVQLSRISGEGRVIQGDDALAFKADVKAKRLATLAELTALSQELGLYD